MTAGRLSRGGRIPFRHRHPAQIPHRSANSAPMSTATAPTPIRKSLFVDSTPLLGDPLALRERAAEDGYLFFKQRLPADAVLSLRAELLAILDKYGWRQPGQDALGGLIDYDAINRLTEEEMHRTDVGVTADAYHDVQRLESFHRLPHHPRLLEI